MSRLVTWAAPISAIVSCCAVAEMIYPGDLWLGALMIVAAIVILILPALSRTPADDASTALPPLGGTQPAAGVIEATPAATRERAL